MKLKQILLLFLLLLLGYGCAKKKYPESVVENDVVYYARMDVDGQSTEIKAGLDGYYLYSDFSQDSNLVYNFTSRFASSTCTNCLGTLEFKLYDRHQSLFNAPVDIDSTLFIGKRNFQRDSNGLNYTVVFQSTFNKATVSDNLSWDFGHGVEANGYMVSKIFNTAGPYNVCLTAKSINSCYSTICNEISFDKSVPRVSVSSIAINSDSLKFSANVVGGKTPYSYSWNMGDGTTETGANPTHIYRVQGSYPVELTVKDALGKTTTFKYNAVTKNDASSCAANYSIVTVSTSTDGVQNWSKASITYSTTDGNVYQTARIDQANDAVYEILSVESAGLNEKGQAIKKVKIRFSGTLFNGTKNIKIQNGEAVIAVAYQ